MKKEIIEHFRVHFAQLSSEINAFPDEEALWQIRPGITNSAGNLCYHLIGNLKHFIGFVLGQSDYVRNRDLEFTIKGLTKKELNSFMADCLKTVENTILAIPDLDQMYPDGYFNQKEMSIHFVLIKLITHFNYHLGQINYHRRLLFPDSSH